MAVTGTYDRTLDEKRRLAIPKTLREELGDSSFLYLTRGTNRSISVRSPASFDRLAERITKLPDHDPHAELFRRILFSETHKVELDGQGRIRIPDRLAQLAGLDKEVILVGAGDLAEIWDQAAWNSYHENKDFDQLASQLFGKSN